MPSTISDLTVAAQLKAGTAALHRSSEAALLPALNNIASRSGYARVLETFYGFFQPVEKLIGQQINQSILPDIKDRRNSDLIIRDLEALGHNHNVFRLAERLPEISNVFQALGAMYVLEGSTLGGRMIARMLRKNEAIGGGEAPTNFFDGYGEATGEKWTRFLSGINAYSADAPQMISAANDCFETFTNWIEYNINNEQKN